MSERLRLPRLSAWRWAVVGFVLAAVLVPLCGCGPSGPEVVQIRGKVTYGGGDWPAPGVLYFNPAEAAPGLPLRPASAKFDTDGNFLVTSFDDGDGLIPGKYQVGVECWENPPSMDGGGPPVSYVAKAYESSKTSGLEVTIQPGDGLVEVSFDVPKR
jgi:hypothetical protein